MSVKSLILGVLETIIKVVVAAVLIMFIYKGITAAYDFGYKVFADEPVSVNNGRTITVGIAENATAKDVANMLEEKGLISDAKLFVVQELLSAYHNEIKPGIYDLRTDMTAHDMLQIMASGENIVDYGVEDAVAPVDNSTEGTSYDSDEPAEEEFEGIYVDGELVTEDELSEEPADDANADIEETEGGAE